MATVKKDAPVKKPVAKKATTRAKAEIKNKEIETVKVDEKPQNETLKKTDSDLQKTEEKVLSINKEKTQKADNQVDKALQDFFTTETENASESQIENKWENPPLEPKKEDTVILEDGREIPAIDSGRANIEDWGTALGDEPRIELNEEMEASSDMNLEEFFEDSDFMAETIVELLDMGATMGLSALAKDFNNPSADIRWGLSDSKKKKIIKPLKMVLAKREVKTSPEVMLIMVIVASYIPLILTALSERSAKKKLEENVIAKKKKEALAEKSAKGGNGRPTTCQRCKKEATKECKCPEGPKLSKYMREKLGLDKKES